MAKLNASGSALTYSTYLGGSGDDIPVDIVVDGSGNAYVTGQTNSTNFPTASPLQASNGGGVYDAFVTKLNAAGSTLTYSTYLGGSGEDRGIAIAVDGSGSAYLTGYTASTNFPTASPLQATYGGGTDDAFVSKLNAAGSALTYSTYLGGGGSDRGHDIVVDGSSNAYLTGYTQSSNFPTQSPQDASLGGSQDVFVAKLASAPAISLSATALSFGNVEKGQSAQQTFTVSNTGTEALTVSGITVSGSHASQFTVSPTTFTINAGAAAQTVTVAFAPTSSGAKSASLSVAHNAAGSPSSVSLSGTGVDTTPPAAPSGLTATAGNNQVSLSWTANAESDLSHYVVYRSTTSGFIPAPADSVGRVNKPGTTFTNTGLSAGTYHFKIAAVDSTGNKSSASAQASATLAPGYSQSSSSLSLGNVNVGSSGTATFTVSNTGTAALNITGITVTGTDASQFTVSPTTFTVNVGAAAQTVTVTFTPTSSGDKSASLSIAHNAAGSPSSVALSGTGMAAVISVSTTSLAFGDVQVGQNKALTFTVGNTGNAALTISSIARTGADSAQFTVSPTSFTVNTGAVAQTVTVTFTPSSAGAKSASLSIAHNAAGSPSTVSLTGNGTAAHPPPAPVINVSVTSLTMDNTNVGTTSQKTFTINNTGNVSLSVTGITVGGTEASQFTVSPTTATVAAGGSQTITVTFTPSSSGAKSVSLSIAHNAAGSPSSVALFWKWLRPDYNGFEHIPDVWGCPGEPEQDIDVDRVQQRQRGADGRWDLSNRSGRFPIFGRPGDVYDIFGRPAGDDNPQVYALLDRGQVRHAFDISQRPWKPHPYPADRQRNGRTTPSCPCDQSVSDLPGDG
ncbi:MAG: hypothetical protein A3F84_24070 [Candidatus Handelsmanbacteria bacterium RIFCSPLOWO2_12_FULL_64_10]|uniref:Fibronectin type-III domain-containing protein n=1 Tax=Handelsmanbacteria sp. (strain RIFCSPLOWO2_12_FULL_64_10) TaxID=1817868 RepID=A0A1F6C360_HANXR|nr:MAG: hypothetical protein A3F84_24070 [Candidatus Handelsmanbacteria bacterium RIFCSPLOWO2_12_FULL_64_10]